MMQTNQREIKLACCEEALFLTLGYLNTNSAYEIWKMGSPAVLMEAGVDFPPVCTIPSRQRLMFSSAGDFSGEVQGILHFVAVLVRS